MTISEINNMIENSKKIELEGPQPLRKETTASKEFPITALPPIMHNAALGLQDKIKAPLAMCAQSILATTNLLVQGHADVMLPYGQIKPISCFFISIGGSGERKTACDSELLTSIHQYEKELKHIYINDLREWEDKNEIWNAEKNRILKDKRNYPTFVDKQKAIKDLGEKPKRPLKHIIICSEPTFEGLYKLLENGAPNMGIFSSEGGQFIGGHGMREENKLKTSTGLSSFWDGEPAKRIRAGDDISVLYGRRVAMHLMVQPLTVNSLLADRILKDQGFLSRMLISFPTSTIGQRFNSEKVKEESLLALEEFNSRVKQILYIPLPIKEDTLNELNPKVIKFSIEAEKLFNDFSDHIEALMAPGKELEEIRGFASKLAEHASRIACTMALFEDLNVEELSYKYMKMGTEIALYYLDEALRLSDQGMTDPEILLAEKLLNWLHNNWDEDYISLPNIYQSGPNAIHTKDQAEKAVKILESHNWLKKIDGPFIIKNVRRKDVWEIIRR